MINLKKLRGRIMLYSLILFILNAFSLKAFNQNSNINFEQIYIHSDKNIYVPGEDIWFKAYILNDLTNIPSKNGRILYVDLLDHNSKIILSGKYPIQEGTAFGDFQLSDTLQNGTYHIVAYTENMINYPPDYYCYYDIIIDATPSGFWSLNYYPVLSKLSDNFLAGEVFCSTSSGIPLHDVKVQYTIQTPEKKYSGSQKTDSLGKIYINWEIPEEIDKDEFLFKLEAEHLDESKELIINVPFGKNGIVLDFYPESGHLIQGLVNNIAFKANDNYGSPLTITAELINQNGEFIKDIRTTYNGMGMFSFTPVSNESYYVKLKNPVIKDTLFALPRVIESGYILSANQEAKSVLSIHINMTPDLAGKDVKLSVSDGFESKNIFQTNLENEKFFSLITSPFPVGISTLTLYSEDLPVAERLIFMNKHKKLHVSINTEKESYKPREKVDMNITVLDDDGKPASANLSLSVSESNRIINKNENISTSLLLASNLNGISGDLSYYLEDSERADSALNILLLTHGWRKINLIEEYSKIVVNKHKHGIRGTVYLRKNKPAKFAQVQIINTKTWQLISTTTNEKGRFFFPIEDYISIATNQNLSISAALPNKSKKLIITLDPNMNFENLSLGSPGEDKYLVYNLKEIESIEKDDIKKESKKEARSWYTNFDETTEFIEEVVITESKIDPSIEEARKKVYAEYTKDAEEIHTNFINSTAATTGVSQGGVLDHSILDLVKQVNPNFEVINEKVVFRGRNSIYGTNVSGALFVVDGVPMGHNITSMGWINPRNVKEIKVTTSPGAAIRYGSNSKGLIEITLLKGGENNVVTNKTEKEDENISIIKGYSISREFSLPYYGSDTYEPEKSFDLRSTIYWNPNLIIDQTGTKNISFYTGDKKTFFQCRIVGINKTGQFGNAKKTIKVD